MRVYFAAAAATISVTGLYFALQPHSGLASLSSNITEPAFSLVALLSSLYTVKRYGSVRAKGIVRCFLWLTVAYFLWFLGEATWSFYVLCLGMSVPYPSIADIFWLAGYPSILFAMFVYLRPFRQAVDSKRLASALVISAILTAATVMFLVAPVLQGSIEPVEQVIDFAYPIFDVALLFSSILGILAFAGGKIGRTWYCLAIGAAFMAIADIMFSYTAALGVYYEGHPLELFYHYAYVMFALATYEHSKAI
ncbi:hypothetical protein KEJ39_08670 [Candidatus Bathyarchaeota archaeon]|nr:hypothetical protein [Candidatus Bathyarchaeota archaeon]